MTSNIGKIAEKRELEPLWFSEFLEQISTNTIDLAIEGSILELENALMNKSQEEYEQYTETNNYNSSQTDYISSELLSIYEVKILFLYKNVERNLKKIISVAYNITFDKSSNWLTLLTILKSKNINYNATGFPFEDINQLRIVNNSIKHSYNEMSVEMLKINEFKRNLVDQETERSKRKNKFAKRTVHYEDLKEFYGRVKDSPGIWIDKIGGAIYSDKFKFSNKRLNNMAVELATKLDKNKADKLIESLKRLY